MWKPPVVLEKGDGTIWIENVKESRYDANNVKQKEEEVMENLRIT
jgi:hypothetical protein